MCGNAKSRWFIRRVHLGASMVLTSLYKSKVMRRSSDSGKALEWWPSFAAILRENWRPIYFPPDTGMAEVSAATKVRGMTGTLPE